MKKTTKETTVDTIEICFEEQGVAVKGTNVSRLQQVQGILAMLVALVERCDGNSEPIKYALRAIREKEEKEDKEEHKNVKAYKFGSLSDFAKFLMSEIEKDKAEKEDKEDKDEE